MTKNSVRERGTLNHTLPQSPVFIILFFALISSVVATYCYEYSLNNKDIIEYNDLAITILKSGLGVLSVVVGIIYADPFVYGLSFATAMLSILTFSGHMIPDPMVCPVPMWLKCASPSILYIVSKISILRTAVCSLLGTKLIVNHINLLLISIIPFLSILVGCCNFIANNEKEQVQFILTPSILAGVISLYVMYLFYTNRGHKHGGLFTSKDIGAGVTVALSVLYSVLSSADLTQDINVLMPFLLGAAVSTCFVAALASVADVWHTVGTGQFHMVSIDTVGIFFYFALPFAILVQRFFDKYNEGVNDFTFYAANLVLNGLKSGNFETFLMNKSDYLFKSILFFVTLPTVIGIPLIHYLCPINGHLFGRVYTHGIPNSKKVAVCIKFADFFKESNDIGKEYEKVWQSLQSWGSNNTTRGSSRKKKEEDTVSLNIFITKKDLEHSSEIIIQLAKMGHTIGLTVDHKNSSTLKDTFEVCKGVLKEKSVWYFPGSDSIGKRPASYHTAFKLGMRSLLWSCLVDVSSSRSFTDGGNVQEMVKEEVEAHGGGSFFYLTKEGNTKQESQFNSVILFDFLKILESLGQTPVSVSSLTIEDQEMKL